MSHKPVPRQAYHHGDLRSALLDAGLRLLRERSVDDLGLRELARDVGVSPAAIYRHFPDKNALMAALAVEGLERMAAAQRQATQAAGGGKAGFLASGMAYVRFAVDFPGRFHLMFRHDLLLKEQPTLERATGQAWDALEKIVLAIRGQPDGAELDAEGEAMLIGIWSTAHGFAHLTLDKKLARITGCGSDDDMLENLFPTIIDTLWVKKLG